MTGLFRRGRGFRLASLGTVWVVRPHCFLSRSDRAAASHFLNFPRVNTPRSFPWVARCVQPWFLLGRAALDGESRVANGQGN